MSDPLRSSFIYGHGPHEERAPEAMEESLTDYKRNAWHKHGMLVVQPEQIEDATERDRAINLGNQLYGKRGRG